MHSFVACLYVGGAAMTVFGVLHGYWRAKRQKLLLGAIKERSDALTEPTPVQHYEAALSDDQEHAADLHALSAANERELERLLRQAGVVDPPPTYDDMRLPVSYWSRRAALTDALLEFKADGAIALSGVVVSTVASVWSLYL